MKTFQVFDQRFPNKQKDGWTANLVSAGEVEAEDSAIAFKLAKKIARFPVLLNHDDWAEAIREERRLHGLEA